MKCIYKTLKSLDFMGDPMNFKINKSETFKTVFGGLLSFMIYLSFLYFFYLFGNDFIFKTNLSRVNFAINMAICGLRENKEFN